MYTVNIIPCSVTPCNLNIWKLINAGHTFVRMCLFIFFPLLSCSRLKESGRYSDESFITIDIFQDWSRQFLRRLYSSVYCFWCFFQRTTVMSLWPDHWSIAIKSIELKKWHSNQWYTATRHLISEFHIPSDYLFCHSDEDLYWNE